MFELYPYMCSEADGLITVSSSLIRCLCQSFLDLSETLFVVALASTGFLIIHLFFFFFSSHPSSRPCR